MSWETSTRRSRLPKDWAKRRAKVKRRARGRCEAETHEPECDGIGTECDHVRRGDDHSLDNLQWLSTPCHKAKTQTEGRRDLKLPSEPHPGWAGAPAPRGTPGPRG